MMKNFNPSKFWGERGQG